VTRTRTVSDRARAAAPVVTTRPSSWWSKGPSAANLSASSRGRAVTPCLARCPLSPRPAREVRRTVAPVRVTVSCLARYHLAPAPGRRPRPSGVKETLAGDLQGSVEGQDLVLGPVPPSTKSRPTAQGRVVSGRARGGGPSVRQASPSGWSKEFWLPTWKARRQV
jgi:hypothetical protein